jgi:hypothetical protein
MGQDCYDLGADRGNTADLIAKRRCGMQEAGVNPVPLSLAQAAALADLVELEARWENLRDQPTPKGGPLPRETLVRKQMAHDAFQAKLLVYNRRYTPPHVPELLLNTAARLGKWCQAMLDLYRLIEPDLSAHCPGSIVEKAYRWADRIARRTNRSLVSAQASPRFVGEVIAELESLGRWCAAGIRQAPAE